MGLVEGKRVEAVTADPEALLAEPPRGAIDLAQVCDQDPAKLVEIAATGGHNILFSGPRGAGKTLLARALPTVVVRNISRHLDFKVERYLTEV